MTKFTILGCGSSLGSPWITNYWGKLNRKNKLNIRTRCSAHIKKGDLSVIIDTSPDIKKKISTMFCTLMSMLTKQVVYLN